MKFSYRDTVKWHDTDANRCVRPSRILTYMQEAANLQMAANSRNLDKLRDEEGLAFLLSRISIRIYGDLHAYDPFDSETWICEGHGAATTRCFRILREGESAVKDYKKFLSGGCSKEPVELLRDMGVDMRTSAPVNDALSLFGELIDELSALLG